ACVENVKSGSQTWFANYGGPTHLVFLPPAVNDVVTSCHLMTVQALDDANVARAPFADQPVAITSNSGTPAFYAEANGGCTGASATSFPLLSTGSTLSFYYTDGTVGTPTLTATPTGSSMAAATQGENCLTACVPVAVTTQPTAQAAIYG